MNTWELIPTLEDLRRVQFGSPLALVLLIIPALLLLWPKRRAGTVSLPSISAVPTLPRTLRQRLLWLPPMLRLLALAALIVGLARPRIGEGRSVSSTEAVAIQLVVDRSGSMGLPMTLDGQEQSRLDIVKQVLKEFLLGNGKDLSGRGNDIIGLVRFARFAETACPLVRDHRALQQLVDAIPLAQHQFEDGTGIGDGLALAAARLRTAEQDLRARHSELAGEDLRIKSKVIILLTDGINNAGDRDPIESAKLAAEWGIRVYTIGVGSDTYQTIRTPFGTERVPVRADVDAATLKAVADATGGMFWRAQDGRALRDIYSEINRLEKSEVKTLEYTDYRELFTPVALLAGALVFIQVLLSTTWLRRAT